MILQFRGYKSIFEVLKSPRNPRKFVSSKVSRYTVNDINKQTHMTVNSICMVTLHLAVPGKA